MPITKDTLKNKISTTHDDWVFIEDGALSDQPLDSGIVPSWQFRLTIKPTRANAIKALNALASLPQFNEASHPTCKVMLPSETSNLSTWDGTIDGLDRDQRGKEICVSIPYVGARIKPPFYEGDYPSKEYVKSLMCTMWKALQDAGVEMAYTPFHKDEREIPCISSITPFAYSSFKPYKERHGILSATHYNPLHLENPLDGISIAFNDLRRYRIHPMGITKSAQRIIYQINHYSSRKRDADKALNSLIGRARQTEEYIPIPGSSERAVYDNNISYRSKLSELSSLAADKQTTDAVLATQMLWYCTWSQVNSPDLLLPSRTSLDDKLFTRHLGLLESLAREADKSDTHLRNKYLRTLPARIQEQVSRRSFSGDEQFFRVLVDELIQDIQQGFNQEMDASVTEMAALTKNDPPITRGELATAYKFYPQEFQRIYQRLAHLDHEKELILAESSRMDRLPKAFNHPQSYGEITKNNPDPLTQAQNLLRDYTKNDSVFSRAAHFHWNRHHVKEVNNIVKDIDSGNIANMDELIEQLGAIPLQNPNGSLARRIEFIAIPYTEKKKQQFQEALGTKPGVSTTP